MGGILSSCLSPSDHVRRSRPPVRRRGGLAATGASVPLPDAASNGLGSSSRWSKARSGRREDGVMTHEEALAAARLLLQDSIVAGGGSLPFDRSSSLRFPESGRKKQALPRSSSTRPRSLADPTLQPQQLVNQDINVNDLETDHFVLVHGGVFGAWCWYKTITLLEEGGFKVDAIDLTGSGINSFDTNKITSLSQYVKPLIDFMENIGDGKKVILVGHDFGGTCISYTMEAFPEKITKAVFISATMLANGQSILEMFNQQVGPDDLLRKGQIFIYANGADRAPTAIDFDKILSKDLLFNQSPAKDIALASVSMRPIPFAPLLEKLSLSECKYGSVRRFYIETTEDNAFALSMQQSMCNSSPPERVFLLKGADHAPFFSKPQALHRYLVDIAKLPLLRVQQPVQPALTPD